MKKCTITGTRLSNERKMIGVLIWAFEVLLELLDVRPQFPSEAPLTARATSREVGKFSLDGSGDRVAVDGRMRW